MNNLMYKSRIDTLETRELTDNRNGPELIELKGVEVQYIKNDTVITRYNPNNTEDTYSQKYSLRTTEENLKTMQQQLGVIHPQNTRIRRIDIATDIDGTFEDLRKFLDLAHKCIRAQEVGGRAWTNIDEKDLEASNYLYRNPSRLEIEFYDKRKQSFGRAKYPTRLEIRFLRVYSNNLSLHVKNTIKLWNRMPDSLNQVEKQMLGILKQKWEEEYQKNHKLKFSDFVYKYSNFIYTREILAMLYSETGLKRAFNYWIQDYRKKYNIQFYTRRHLIKFSEGIVRSLDSYLQN